MKQILQSLILVSCIFVVFSTSPFEGKSFYVNPSFQAEIDTTIATATGTTLENLKIMRETSSAYWLDVKSKLNGTDLTSAEGILIDAKKKGDLVIFIVYDLPNRDCHAKASNGEICCYPNADGTCNYDKSGDCKEGLEDYKTNYIDKLAAILAKYQDDVSIVLIIEPDSLPNLATNAGDSHCGNSATTAAYEQGIPYAVNTLATSCPKCVQYLDAAHGGWLGWSDNTGKFLNILKSLNIQDKLRGFSTNVANYQPIGEVCPFQADSGTAYRNDYCLNNQHQSDSCCSDPCKLESQWNPGNNELNYAAGLRVASQQILNFSPQFLIDSGRNGVDNMRSDCSNWCNIRGAGVGLLPTSNTNSDYIDAFHWLKTPGECDGCTQTLPSGNTCPRYDSFCGSSDSIGSQSGEPRAPEAGKWFDYEVKQLASNAVFTNGTASSFDCKFKRCEASATGKFSSLSSCVESCSGNTIEEFLSY